LAYFEWVAKDRISLLLADSKSEQDDLTAGQLKQLKNQLMP
jgi:septum formation topological specificity factor MinE